MRLYRDTKAGQETINYLSSKIVTAKTGVKELVECSKCNGTGGIPSFNHVAEGVCFQCAGAGKTYSYRNVEQKNTNSQLKTTISELEKKVLLSEDEAVEFLSTDFNLYTPKGITSVVEWLKARGYNIGQQSQYLWIDAGALVDTWISNSIANIRK